jgi:2-C-methyl-D-erythritol 2,4-cyclodiphosphate synthase
MSQNETRSKKRFPFRVGLGYDIHRLVPGRRLILAGIDIEHEKGFKGHSDGDPLTHALMDALLGAIGERDIGVHFPDSDERYEGACSLDLLLTVVGLVRARGYDIVNVDTTLVIERPRISPHVDSIRSNLARVLGVEMSSVGVKVTSNEEVDDTGHGDAAFAHAVALIAES